eukprot:6712916-Ditylum_brightwellii.AAC.1
MSPENFYNHQEWQDMMYRQPEGGGFKQSHVFTIYGNINTIHMRTTLLKQDTIKCIERVDTLLPRKGNRKANMMHPEERAEK